ncbi:MAG: glycosyltransferase, partial [Gemmatimonadota bacterium]
MQPLKVLVWGTAEQGACAYFRGHLFDEPLRELGVELRHISKVDFKPEKGWENRPAEEVLAAGKMTLDTSDLDWADVVMFRRYYNTSFKCALDRDDLAPCKFRTLDPDEARAHPHGAKEQDGITRAIWPFVRDNFLGGIVYETDDNHWEIKPWNGFYGDVILERDLIRDMTRRADLVTVSTPVLAREYGRFNPRVRVIRNTVDPDLYTQVTERTDPRTRLVYYGSTARMRDYAGYTDERGRVKGGYARAAVDDAHRRYGLHRVFLGTNPGTEHIIRRVFDEQTPYIENIPEFSRALANVHGDIGIAPLGGDDFDQAKSELHWLEYSLAGMAFVGERYSGTHGPYNVIRRGVDGLLARGAQEWHDAIKQLTLSRDLREQLAGAAKERVLAEYDYRVRAAEWADAFRWAAENAG